MAIIVVCPTCSAKWSAPDSAAWKKVRCTKAGCGTIVQVTVPLATQFEVVNDEEPQKPTPRKVIKTTSDVSSTSKQKLTKSPDEGQEHALPISTRRPEEVDDHPQRRAAGLPPAAIAGIILGGVLVICGVGYGIYALAFKDSRTAGNNSGDGGGSKAAVPQGWVEYKTDESGFRAYFPVKPDERKIAGTVTYMVEDKNQKASWLVIVVTLPDNVNTEQRKPNQDQIMKGFLSTFPGKELSHSDTKLAGLSATEYVFEVPSGMQGAKGKGVPAKSKSGGKTEEQNAGRMVFRFLVTDKRIFLAGVGSETGMPSSEWTSGFFDNFELLK